MLKNRLAAATLGLSLAGVWAGCTPSARQAEAVTASGSLIALPGEVAAPGKSVYTDRGYTFEKLGRLAGLRYLATTNDDKIFVSRVFLPLQAAPGTELYVALDQRQDPTGGNGCKPRHPRPSPAWLADFSAVADGRDEVTTTDHCTDFVLYRWQAPADGGQLTLGGNVDHELSPVADLSMYLIFYRGELSIPPAGEGSAAARPRRTALEEAAVRSERLGADALCLLPKLPVKITGPLLERHDIWWRTHGRQGQRADFRCAHLGPLDFSAASANLAGADFIAADLRAADLSTAALDSAEMEYADLSGARLVRASLRATNLIKADLSKARLTGADLSRAILSGTVLRDADLTGARLDGAIFEPASLPDIRPMARAKGLKWMTYRSFPDALISLRDSFKKAGFRVQEREVTAALEREYAARAQPFERWVRRLLGLTCDYGVAVSRPLWLLLISILIFPFLYELAARCSPRSKLLLIPADEDPPARPQVLPPRGRWRYLLQLSLLSAFSIGQASEVGKWCETLLAWDGEVRPTRALRMLSGVQSLLGLLLLALWLLLFLGRPFE